VGSVKNAGSMRLMPTRRASASSTHLYMDLAGAPPKNVRPPPSPPVLLSRSTWRRVWNWGPAAATWVSCFREHSVSFREHSVSFREHSVSFREHSVSFREHSVSFREHEGEKDGHHNVYRMCNDCDRCVTNV
jgi:hypothetical protein